MRPQRPITDEQKKELASLLKSSKDKANFQRVLCIWLRALFHLNSDEVGMALGLKGITVKIIQSRYFKHGGAALLGVGRGGRRRENLSIDEEQKLLGIFNQDAIEGGMLVVNEVKKAYEKRIGHGVPKSTIYRMLARHGWRKISPRPYHPQANKEEQKAFKKTSNTNKRKASKREKTY